MFHDKSTNVPCCFMISVFCLATQECWARHWGSSHWDRPIPGRSFVPPGHSWELPDRAASHSAPSGAVAGADAVESAVSQKLHQCNGQIGSGQLISYWYTKTMVEYGVSWETQSTSASFSKIQASSCLGEHGQVTWKVLSPGFKCFEGTHNSCWLKCQEHAVIEQRVNSSMT